MICISRIFENKDCFWFMLLIFDQYLFLSPQKGGAGAVHERSELRGSNATG